MDDRGRLMLPSALRRCLDMHPGDRLILTLEPEGGLRATPARQLAQRLLGLYRHVASERSLVDELIAERRQEAEREARERQSG